ncbi:hypothetical protein L0152_15850 [bacterium]|nr:hypothetical protein [bacterium]
MYWLISILLLLAILLASFIIIARKGRELRRAQPLPPPATKAFLRWVEDGKTLESEIHAPFYLGRKSDSNVVLKNARADYELCIFYHKQRFAFEALDKAAIILVNGEENMAGYLGDADVIQVAGREFSFHCF